MAPASVAPADEAPKGQWYGWQIMLIEAGAFAAGLATQRYEAIPVIYLVSGPVAHSINGNGHFWGRSALTRIVLPLGGVLIGGLIGGGAADGMAGPTIGAAPAIDV